MEGEQVDKFLISSYRFTESHMSTMMYDMIPHLISLDVHGGKVATTAFDARRVSLRLEPSREVDQF